jgi:hypothetical protein
MNRVTERASYTCTVKEYGDGKPFLMLEPNWETLKLLNGGFLSFDLPEGTSYEGASKVAQFFNENIRSVAYTAVT